ncbi:RNA polymerase II transcription factor SIII subunit A-domain-containing protein [Kockovaella imperatae]|uniref:RNA polymerase II transcription factor SIII subunit A-domain-containing protein n=1 Tax=Kockovaella imperatae TaxID=4999 RepID=A0A1Y1UCI3_9TREE|nr:RNA polymerase II transcription factor SIII subunit A-domain-containing protein [Kockovaella imperatae]ORX35237.1 RNA polymerase II transcription factor SIII subunit A-domain-containing protein [Kockovaella imperatae]
MPRDALEYEEADEEEQADLFGSENERAESDVEDDTNPEFSEYNTAVPIGTSVDGPCFTSSAHAGPSKLSKKREQAPVAIQWPDAQTRLADLRDMKRYNIPLGSANGVKSLKEACMFVIRSNGKNIWHIGDVPYTLLKPFLDYLPASQLAEVEDNSPSLKKDTDWLWEIFLLQEFPLYHEKVRERKGEPRTHGWRRMYRDAHEDAEERKAAATARATALYKRLEEEKKAKKIVRMDHPPPETNKRRKHIVGSVPAIAASAAMMKARSEINRARISVAHASGKVTAPPRTTGQGSNQLFVNPYLAKSGPSGPVAQPFPSSVKPLNNRIPMPKVKLPPNGGMRPGGHSKTGPNPALVNKTYDTPPLATKKPDKSALNDFFDSSPRAVHSKPSTSSDKLDRIEAKDASGRASKRTSSVVDPSKGLFMAKKPRLSGR